MRGSIGTPFGRSWRRPTTTALPAALPPSPCRPPRTSSCGTGRSYLRKGLELPVALYLDLIWSKRHMMQTYLNIAEWGDGVFGAEAAARRYFGKASRDLTRREAALLAAALPNPLVRNPARPSGRSFPHSSAHHGANGKRRAAERLPERLAAGIKPRQASAARPIGARYSPQYLV